MRSSNLSPSKRKSNISEQSTESGNEVCKKARGNIKYKVPEFRSN